MTGLLTWRSRRQAAALAVVAVIAGGLALFFIGKVLPEASCADNRRNRGETDVDCGGPCAPCELKNPKPIAVFWARAGRADARSFDAATLVENHNPTLSADIVSYEFTLLDEYGIIGQKKGTTFIYPSERLMVIEPDIETTREPVRVEFSILRAAWKSVLPQTPAIVVERREYATHGEGEKKESVIEAEIFNADTRRFRRVEVSFAAFDGTGNLLGANRVLTEDMPPGNRRVVRSIWPRALAGTVAKIEITPRVNLFETDAIVAP